MLKHMDTQGMFNCMPIVGIQFLTCALNALLDCDDIYDGSHS